LIRAVCLDACGGGVDEGRGRADACDVGAWRNIRTEIRAGCLATLGGYSQVGATSSAEGLGGAVGDAVGEVLTEGGRSNESSSDDGEDEAEHVFHSKESVLEDGERIWTGLRHEDPR